MPQRITDNQVLVTGGLGFIGSHLVQRLLFLGARITVYDNFDEFYPGKEDNLREIRSAGHEFKLEEGDVRDYAHLSSTVKGQDLIFHLAAQAGVRYCNQFPVKANSVNVNGTLNVLAAAREHGIKKMVYASSSSVYGDPVYLPLDEEHPTNPNSPYGASKLAAEHYVRVSSRVYGISAASLRYFSVYGPRGRPDQVVYSFAKRIKEGRHPEIFGDGEQTRDFTFVSDIVDATILAMEKDESNGQVFNIGDGSRVTINQLADMIIEGMGKKSAGVEPVHREKSKGDFPDTEANNQKAKKLLSWNPKVSLSEGLELFLDWFRSK